MKKNYKNEEMNFFKLFLALLLLLLVCKINAQVLQVKEGKSAIVKEEPTGSGEHIVRLIEGTKVVKLGEVPRYYSIQLKDGRTGDSYKGNFKEVKGKLTVVITKESLLARINNCLTSSIENRRKSLF